MRAIAHRRPARPNSQLSAGREGEDTESDEHSELVRLRQENERLAARLRQQRAEDASLEAGRAALHASERRLRDTLESIDNGFLMVDRDWSVIDLNLRVVRMDGRPASRLIGRKLFELWPEAAGTEFEAILCKAMRERQPARLRRRYAGGGHDCWLDLRAFPSVQGLTLFFRDVTEQEEARRRLSRAEASARLAVEAARLGTWSFDPRSGALAWNDRHLAMFGLPPGAPIDYPTKLARIHPDDRTRFDAALQASLDPSGTGEIVQEYRSIDATDGRERWLAAMGQGQFENGECVRFDGVVQDITERRRIAAALAESEGRFRAIAEAAPGIVFVTDAEGMNTYTNPQYSTFTGLPPHALLGHGWLAAVPQEDRERADAVWREAVRSGGSYQIEHRFRRHDGALRWFLCRAVRMGGSQDQPDARIAQWVGTCTDIQELVEARQVLARDRDALEQLVDERTAALLATVARLRVEEARMRALFRQSSECLFLLRVEPGRGPVFLDVNPPAETVLGRTRAETIGRTPREVSDSSADADDAERQLGAALLPGAGPHRYTAHRHHGGQQRVLDAVAVALDGPDRERLVLVTARDVTEQRNLEEALRQSHKMEAIGQLTGGIAHDFNNMLTGITGSLELMRRRGAEGRVADLDRYGAAALDSVRRAAALTHRLLAFARRQALDPKPADLNGLILGMEDLVRRTVGPAIAVETSLAPDLWPILCDANQLESALLNLCLNARDAMPAGGVLRIATANTTFAPSVWTVGQRAEPDAVRISVSDTGAGMEPEVAARAFEPFFTTKPLGQGTGLGLSMLYGFARQSGGQAHLHSEVGRGSTVCIDLPRHRGPAPGARPPPDRTFPAGPAEAGQAILVVEDEALVRELTVAALDEAGYRTLEAADATAAMRILQDDVALDLLLTDVGLPGMNGRQLADAARARRPGLKVLFITGYAHNIGGEAGLVGPGMALLAKPFALEALTRKVRSVLLAC